MKKFYKKEKLLISVFFFFILFSFSERVSADTQATTTITGTPPTQTLYISNCSGVFGGSTYGYKGFYNNVEVFSSGGGGGLPCASPPFISNINTFVGGEPNVGSILRFDFYTNLDFSGNRFAYFLVVFDGTQWLNGGGGTNSSWATTTDIANGQGFLGYLNIPNLLQTKVPFAYFFQLVDTFENLNDIASTSIPTGTISWKWASGTPAQTTVDIDFFSPTTIKYYVTPTYLAILRGIMVAVTYFGTAWFLYHEAKKKHLLS